MDETSEVEARQATELKLRQAHDNLELAVTERARDLSWQIEERKQIETALMESEERFRDFAASGADRFWETDEEFRFTYASDGLEYSGFLAEALIGKQPWEVQKERIDSETWRPVKEAFDQRRPFRDFRVQASRSEARAIHFRMSGAPFFSADGTFKGYRGTTVDEAAEIEARSRELDIQNRFANAMDNLDAGFALWDAEDRFVRCNGYFAAMLTGTADNLVPGVKFDDYMRKVAEGAHDREIIEDREAWIASRLADHRETDSHREALFRDGRWMNIQKKRLRDGSVLTFYYDITELKEREGELRDAIMEADAANQSKSDFMANMSHELRTPLNAIIGFSDVLIEKIFGSLENEKQRKYLGNKKESGTDLLELISELLDVSVIEAGRVQLFDAPVDPAELAVAALRVVTHRANSSGVKLINDILGTQPLLNVDPLRAKQILINLLSNAVKFTPAGGEVTIGCCPQPDGGLSFFVTDTGIGMNQADIQIALARFGQVKRESASGREGTGLGLPLAKGLAEAHGATLEIESQPGRGTTVTVCFPASRVLS